MVNSIIAMSMGAILLLSGCSIATLPAKVAGKLVKRDLVRVDEMATKYGKPAVQQCASYLVSAIDGKQELLDEDVDGVLSLAFKAYLLKETSQVDAEKFKIECQALAAELLLEVARTLRP